MTIKIAGKLIGKGQPTFIIAELSTNHNQSFELAVKTIKAMKEAGADAVKLQTFTPDTITLNCDNQYFQIKQGTIWDGTTLYKLYQQAYTPWEWQPKLKKIAEDLGLVFFSTPFDKTAVDFLEKMKVPAYKVASFEINDVSLIKYIASKKKLVLISTGTANLADIKGAVKACHTSKNNKIVLLKCTSAYPTPPQDMNLKTMTDIKKRFKTLVGLSDHSLGITAPVAATILGANIIEKHFIVDRNLGGPDAAFSLNPAEFKQMVQAVRDAEKILGKVTYQPSNEAKRQREFMRSLFAVEDIKKGEVFTGKNVRSIRPAFGLPPKFLKKIVSKKAKKDIKRGTPLSWKLIE